MAVFKREPLATGSDYYSQATILRQSSLLKSVGRLNRPVGIKEYAWKGMPSDTDEGRMTHHLDKKFLEEDRRRNEMMKSDGLPVGI